MNVFIGLDVSLASTAICAVSESGQILRALSADSDPEPLVHALREIDGTIVGVGLEAGPLSQWLYKHLTDAGFETVLLETRHVKRVLKAMPINTVMRKGLRDYCIWDGSVQCIANRFLLRKHVLC